MIVVLLQMPGAKSHTALAGHIAIGATVYLVALASLYAPTLFRLLRRSPQHSGA